jgi:hypothetical protein
MQKLFGKKILFIGPQFFGYEQDIANELRRQGAEVDFLPDRPFTSPVMKAVTRFRREWILPLADRYFMDSVEAFGRGYYDLIFAVQGEGLSVKTLSILRTLFPKARLVWYLWDSLRNKKSLVPNISAFDECHTFDAADAKSYGMNFRPLFFSSGFSRDTTQYFKYHLSFIGTAHSDRFSIVSNMIASLPEQTNCYWYLYLQAPWVFWAQKLGNPAYRGASITDFRFDPLSKQEVQSVFFDSLAILDIEHPRQTGLTMRTFETMGAGKKLITTNALVKETDFYNQDNILVIERDSVPHIPDAFLRTPYIPPTDAIYQKYSLKGWLSDVVSHVYRSEMKLSSWPFEDIVQVADQCAPMIPAG